MLKKFLLFSLFIIAIKSSAAQNQDRALDSLIQLLKTAKDDTTKVNILNSSYQRLWEIGDFSKAIEYANEAIALADKINFKKGETVAYNWRGYIFREQGDYSKALKDNLTALKISEQINYKHGIASSYLDIGVVYTQQGNYSEALKNHLAGLKISEEIGDTHQMGSYYNNIGNTYMDEDNSDEALKNYLAALKIYQSIGDKNAMSYAYGNIGNVYGQTKNYSKALENHLNALKIEQETGNKQGISNSYIDLGELYTLMKRYEIAKEYFTRGLLISKDIKSKFRIQAAYSGLSRLYSIMGDYKEAYNYQLLYSKIKDSILNESSNKQISQLKIQYETNKKDQQIKSQSLQNIILQNRIYYSVIISLIILSIVILLFYLRSRRKKKEYENKVVGLELEALKSQLNPHFIFNALNSIKSYIETNPQTGADYLGKFSLLMRGVLECGEEREITLGKEMELMEHYIELEKLRLSNKLDYSITFDESFDKEEVMIPPLISQPVIENAIWHGVMEPDKNRLLSICNTVSGKTLTIKISNNATGKKPEVMPSRKRKSFGVKITRERLELLKKTIGREGALSLEIFPGETIATITIPLKEF